MSNKVENTEKEYSKVNINRGQHYVCYSHPTKKNKKGHVQQVTRSIKDLYDKTTCEYDEEKLKVLCTQLNELLENYDDHTKDLTSVKSAKSQFKTKAFGWIIEEKLQEDPDDIVKATLENHIPIPEKSIVYMNTLNSNIVKDYIPKSIWNSNSEYVLVDDKSDDELSVTIEFKGFDDLQEYIINTLIYIIARYVTFKCGAEIEGIFYSYTRLKLEGKNIEKFKKFIDEIKKAYIKESMIKPRDFRVNVSFNNYVCKTLHNDKNRLIDLMYNPIIQKINSNIENANCKDFVGYKLDDNDNVYKILYLKSKGDNKLFFETLDKIFNFNDSEISLAKLVKTVRIKGDILEKQPEKDTGNLGYHTINPLSINSENLLDYTQNTKIRICLDGLLNNDCNLANLLEKVIVWGCAEKCDFYFENKFGNNDFYTLSDSIMQLLSKTNLATHFKYIYAYNLILMKFDKSDIPNTIYTDYNSNNELFFNTFYLSQIFSENVDDKLADFLKFDEVINKNDYDVFKHFSDISNNINANFKTKMKTVFNKYIFEYFDEKNIVKTVKDTLLESFVYAIYNHIFSNEQLLCFDYHIQNYFIDDYNKFMLENLKDISEKINEIVEKELKKIFNYYKNTEDYGVYKKCLLNAIIADVEIPYNYIKEICEKFEFNVINGGKTNDKTK